MYVRGNASTAVSCMSGVELLTRQAAPVARMGVRGELELRACVVGCKGAGYVGSTVGSVTVLGVSRFGSGSMAGGRAMNFMTPHAPWHLEAAPNSVPRCSSESRQAGMAGRQAGRDAGVG